MEATSEKIYGHWGNRQRKDFYMVVEKYIQWRYAVAEWYGAELCHREVNLPSLRGRLNCVNKYQRKAGELTGIPRDALAPYPCCGAKFSNNSNL